MSEMQYKFSWLNQAHKSHYYVIFILQIVGEMNPIFSNSVYF